MMESKGSLIQHQYKMCLYGKPSSILTFQVTTLGDEYDYRMTEPALLPVWQEASKMTGDQVRELLMAFAGMISDCREYLLDYDNVSLEEGSMGIRQDGSIGFKYLPFEGAHVDHRSKTEDWLARLHHHVDISDEAIMTMLHPLSIVIAKEHFTLEGFEALIHKVTGDQFE